MRARACKSFSYRLVIPLSSIFSLFLLTVWQISMPNKLLALPAHNRPTDVQTTITGLLLHWRKLKNVIIPRQVLNSLLVRLLIWFKGVLFICICRLTSFLNLLPAELVSPDHREHRVEVLLLDHVQGLLHVARVETRGRSLDVTHDIHHCEVDTQDKHEAAARARHTDLSWRSDGRRTWVEPDELLDGFQRRRRVSGDFGSPAVHPGAPRFSHLLDFIVVCRHPHTMDDTKVEVKEVETKTWI